MEAVMDRLVKAHQVATLLNVRPATVYDLARRGLLPHIRLREGIRRPLVRFDLEEVRRFIRTKSSMPEAEAEAE
jgi:excisionase family DNA binding protein